ncbi:MAG TPA: 2-oxoglutarate dehydrogenase complex dihydrolipoyllysine-residue succinyltransferase [Gemmatimonadaceae bacterium]|nr:2-oxoglutarate dehydrogenase complex dihydrolipoyllysine-residue succinyltransferase [Gemmatimonadaceae bacterium]
MLQLKVPPLGESIVEATVSRWVKKEGDSVALGETLVELETDKITVEVPAPKAGVLTKIHKAEGTVVKVDELIGEVDETKAGAATAASAPAATAPAASPTAQPTAAESSTKSSPAARKNAAEAGVDINAVSGTGRGGVVSKPDLIEYVGKEREGSSQPANPSPVSPVSRPPSTPAPRTGERETREKLTTRRKKIAENLLASQANTAHLTTFNEIDMSNINALREKFRDRVEKENGVKLTFMPFFIKAACMALEKFPTVNAQLDGDSIIYRHYVNMGIAVASDQGLVVPNIKDADTKGILQLTSEMGAVAKRARDGKLTMDDLTGGTFTITNGGVFGSLVSTPIINFPQVGILGLHKTQDRPVAIDGQVVIRPMMYVALSYNHQIVDGQQAVLFLVRIKELMEDPAAMLVA